MKFFICTLAVLAAGSAFSLPSKVAPFASEEIAEVYHQYQKHSIQDSNVVAPPKKEEVPYHKERLYIAPLYEHFHLNATGIGTFNGNLWGGQIGYEFREAFGLYATANASGAAGSMNAVMNASYIDQIEVFFTGNIGYAIKWGKNLKHWFVPYLGYDYLWLRQFLYIVGYEPLRYTYKKPYLPFGVLFEMYALPCLSFGINYTYLVDIDTRLDIKQLIGSGWFLTKKNDYMLQFPVIFKINEWFDLRLIPYFRKLKFGESTAVTSSGLALGLQPQGYKIWGGDIELSIRF